MKVSELKGAALDRWVARAAGVKHQVATERTAYGCDVGAPILRFEHDGPIAFKPSTEWRDGGPIIEREAISITCPFMSGGPDTWWEASKAYDYDPVKATNRVAEASGPTPLVAAMRCFVASKFGETVEDETAATTA